MHMPMVVIAMPPADFDAWLARRRARPMSEPGQPRGAWRPAATPAALHAEFEPSGATRAAGAR
jgi:heme/copper-type cytochrome/quinol oxidase subunit 2